jgi:hypothetical protein
MGGVDGLWEDERNPEPETLEDHGKQESMGADGRARDGGIPNQNHRKPIAEQSREEESEINVPRNIPTQDAGW